jgi:hypothetical protein
MMLAVLKGFTRSTARIPRIPGAAHRVAYERQVSQSEVVREALDTWLERAREGVS